MLNRLWRDMECARHVPIARMFRRLRLEARRRLADARPTKATDPLAEAHAATLPQPIFPPRAPKLRAEGDDLVLDLLNVETRMPRAQVNWTAGGDQLRRMTLHYMEYLESVDDALFGDLVGQWITANGALAPGAWRDAWNSYALSLRVVVWLQQLARRGDAISEPLRRRMETSATRQLLHLERNLETDIGGNHLIENIRALLWASAYFSGLRAARWRALGLRLLEREIAAQILADGAHCERSPSYQCRVFADLLECRAALGVDPLGGALDAALHRLAQATADLAHPDGAVAQFNDGGLDMAYSPTLCLDAYRRLFGDAPTPRPVFALTHAGYYGARFDDDCLIVDCGRIGPDDLPAHAHADVTSFELSIAGERIFVDQGVYEYVDGERRRRARAGASHDCLLLEGAEMADFFGSFRCGRRPNVIVRRYEPREDGFLLEGAHDGYAHLPGRPIPVRCVDFRPGALVVEDRIEGATDRAATIGLLLHPKVTIEATGTTLRLTRGAASSTFAASAPFTLQPAVWWPNMGVEIATTRILVAWPRGERESRIELRFDRGEARS